MPVKFARAHYFKKPGLSAYLVKFSDNLFILVSCSCCSARNFSRLTLVDEYDSILSDDIIKVNLPSSMTELGESDAESEATSVEYGAQKQTANGEYSHNLNTIDREKECENGEEHEAKSVDEDKDNDEENHEDESR